MEEVVNKPLRVSKWYSFEVCEHCGHRLNDHEKMSNNGTCPYCGHTSKGTVTDYKKVTIRKLSYHPWWRFWDKYVEYQGADEYSREWLVNN